MAKTRKKTNNRQVFWIQLVIAVLLIAAMSIGMLQFGGGNQGSSAAPDFPPWIAGLRIQNFVTGEDAKQKMNTLSEEIPALRDAWMAFYEGGGVVWIGQAQSESEADRLLNIMKNKIQSAFATDPDLKMQTLNKKGISVNIIKLKEQDNEYFYRKNDKVFWISLPTGKAEPFIDEVMDRLN